MIKLFLLTILLTYSCVHRDTYDVLCKKQGKVYFKATVDEDELDAPENLPWFIAKNTVLPVKECMIMHSSVGKLF